MNAVQKLREQAEVIRTAADPLKVIDAWALCARLLPRLPVDPAAAARATRDKDLAALDALIHALEHPAAPAPAPPPPEFSNHELHEALRAFRKRIKAARLADESKLGGRYTTGGHASKIDAMEPPTGFPRGIWKALAAKGLLEDTGQGFYREPPGPPPSLDE